MCKKKQIIDIVPATKKSKSKKILKVIVAMAAIHVAFKAVSEWQKKNSEDENTGNHGNAIKTYRTLLNGRDIKVENEEFKGACLRNMLGGISLNLTNSIIKEDAFINCKNVLGGVDICVPAGVNVRTEGKCVMSGVSNMVPEYESDVPTIYIDVDSLLGGVSIRMTSVKSGVMRDELMENDILNQYANHVMAENSEKKEKVVLQQTQEGHSVKSEE